MILRIDKFIRSQNEFTGRHWKKKHQDTKEWEWSIRAATSRPLPIAAGKMKVKITSMRRYLLDVGNLIGGAKGLIDALVRLGVIKDDSPKWAHITYEQKKCYPNAAQTIIEVQKYD